VDGSVKIIQRSDDGGKNLDASRQQSRGSEKGPEGFSPGGESNKFVLRRENVGTHKWYDGTQHPWEFKRIWQPLNLP